MDTIDNERVIDHRRGRFNLGRHHCSWRMIEKKFGIIINVMPLARVQVTIPFQFMINPQKAS